MYLRCSVLPSSPLLLPCLPVSGLWNAGLLRLAALMLSIGYRWLLLATTRCVYLATL